jgi:hypothetical protein
VKQDITATEDGVGTPARKDSMVAKEDLKYVVGVEVLPPAQGERGLLARAELIVHKAYQRCIGTALFNDNNAPRELEMHNIGITLECNPKSHNTLDTPGSAEITTSCSTPEEKLYQEGAAYDMTALPLAPTEKCSDGPLGDRAVICRLQLQLEASIAEQNAMKHQLEAALSGMSSLERRMNELLNTKSID